MEKMIIIDKNDNKECDKKRRTLKKSHKCLKCGKKEEKVVIVVIVPVVVIRVGDHANGIKE